MSDSKNKPVQTIRHGAIKATIWENTSRGDKTFYSVNLAKSYKQDEEWKETQSFANDDLLKIHLISLEAYEWIRQNQKN